MVCDEPVGKGIIALLDDCVEDLSRLMASGELRKSYPLRSLVYRLEQARTEARAVYEGMDAIFHPEKYPQGSQ